MSNDNEWQEVGGGAQTEMWDEQAGDKTIIGKLVNIKKNIGKNHSNIYELDLGDKKIIGVWGSTVLDSRFETIEVGTDVKIVYNGKLQGKDSRGAYKNYTVSTRKPKEAASEVAKDESKDLPF